MSYTAEIIWKRGPDETFVDNKYSRVHAWIFDGGVQVPASASPHVVPIPFSDPNGVDPEEAFIAALSSCHMLWFLSIAAEKNYRVDFYDDQASGVLGKNGEGKLAMSRVTLNPRVVFGGENIPCNEEIINLHHLAHEACFIANSVKTELILKPIF
ncbi:MAG: OsmC family protein [Anaerolineae bacterium]|nr:OsmC family protein [Anaerolineae bacterium]